MNDAADKSGLDGPQDEWLSASETRRLVSLATLSPDATYLIAARAHAGLIRTRARLLITGGKLRQEDVELDPGFWWAEGHPALEAHWETGDFSTWVDQKIHLQAFGVTFHRAGVRDLAPGAFEQAPAPVQRPSSGGRGMSPHWHDWVAELVAHVHEHGIPDGQGSAGMDKLIGEIETALDERDLKYPSRSTVQPTVKAVLLRLRSEDD